MSDAEASSSPQQVPSLNGDPGANGGRDMSDGARLAISATMLASARESAALFEQLLHESEEENERLREQVAKLRRQLIESGRKGAPD